jgi:DNA polymerase-1
VSENAVLYDPVRCTRTGVGEVEKKFGVPPSMCSDVIALMGDAADGIPGAVGIGVKTAAKMMLQFGGLESMLERVGEVRGKKTQQARSPTPHARPPSIAWT